LIVYYLLIKINIANKAINHHFNYLFVESVNKFRELTIDQFIINMVLYHVVEISLEMFTMNDILRQPLTGCQA